MDPIEAAALLASVPAPYLLDELDRRQRSAQPPEVVMVE